MSDYTRMYHNVDELPQLAFWEADEAFFILGGTFLGIITGSLLTWMVLGVIGAKIFAKFKAGTNRGLIIHWAYWHGIAPLKGFWVKNGLSRWWTS